MGKPETAVCSQFPPSFTWLQGPNTRRQVGILSIPAFCFLFFWFFEVGFLCEIVWLSWNSFLDQGGLELTEFHLPLPPGIKECWD